MTSGSISAHRMDPDLISHLKEMFLSCPICEEEVQSEEIELQLLSCQHYVCGKCIIEMLKKKRKVICPFCRKECLLPESKKFPTFRYAAKLSEFLAKYPNIKKSTKQKPAEVGAKSGNMQITLLEKFGYTDPQHTWLCWGTHGKLYSANTCVLEHQGLRCINVFNSEIQKFGSMHSRYSGGIFVGEELYVYNCTKGYVEVYRNEHFVRSWYVHHRSSNFMWMAKHPINGGILVLFKTGRSKFILQHYDTTGTVQLSENDAPLRKHFEMLKQSGIVSSYRSSIWFVSDGYLWEQPVEQTSNKTIYDEASRRCKVSSRTQSCTWGENKIIYAEHESNCIKALDLSALELKSTADDSAPSRRKRHSKVPAKLENFEILLTDVEIEKGLIAASGDNFLAILGEDAMLKIYKIIQATETSDISVQSLMVSDIVIPGPDYPTWTERWDRSQTKLYDFLDKLIDKLGAATFFLLLIICFTYYAQYPHGWAFSYLEYYLRRFCESGSLQQASFGWPNLFITTCKYQEALPPDQRTHTRHCKG